MTRNNWRIKMCFVCFILECTVQNKGNLVQVLKVGTWRYELMHSLWRRALIGLLSMAYSFCLFISTQNHQPREVPLTMSWAFPHQSTIMIILFLLSQRVTVFKINILYCGLISLYDLILLNLSSKFSKYRHHF